MNKTISQPQFCIGNRTYSVSRPHSFGVVLSGSSNDTDEDYLHNHLLAPENRDDFFSLIESEGLVVCKNVRSSALSYRKVRGKSSHGKLSQAEYYHHDGCSCPKKPRVVEIRLPHQAVERDVATAIARFPDVIKAMLISLPKRLLVGSEIAAYHDSVQGEPAGFPTPSTWDKIQGRVTRLVRREMGAESCRAYFRDVDQAAGAYDFPWEMGESRLMLNAHDDLTKTMQHRRAYQKARSSHEQNGSLVKRWTAEES